jgi:NhaP-type Na+/H+ or K+/H+ antiporter
LLLPISDPAILLLSFFINPLIHYIVGMWIGYFLRKTSRRLQDGILKFLFITPLIVLFLFWRYG